MARPNRSKSEELAALDGFIADLGMNSYLGPWLAENRDAIARDITSDCYPSPTLPAAAVREARAVLENARAEATRLVAAATAQAEQASLRAQAHVEGVRHHARKALLRLADGI